jgi:hypothetical protein
MQQSYFPIEEVDKKQLNIISASRRTDIPAFYTPWLMNRLRAGYACYPNPFTGEIHTVSLHPKQVHSIVFWSKHYQPLLPHLNEISDLGYRFVFHYTITGVPRTLEPQTPNWQDSVRIFRKLADHTSPRQVFWRFDPILFADEWGMDFYLHRFGEIATALTGATERCYFSFAAFYGKVKRSLQRAAIHYYDPALEVKRDLMDAMTEIAEACGMTLHACCQGSLVGASVQKAHCIDGDLLADLFPDRHRVTQIQPTRKGCGCFASRDIGIYDTCPFGCLYCYANQNRKTALARYRSHDPGAEKLCE